MLKKNKNLAIFVFIVAMFSACASKPDLYNLSPNAWFSQIIEDIQKDNLDDADKHYIAFSSEHIGSPLLEQTDLILSQAHVDDESFDKALFYIDEYIKRFGTTEKTQYGEFLKIKIIYQSFSKPNRDQKLIQDSILETKSFIANNLNSKYRPLAETMLVRLELAQESLNKEIKNLYSRTGRTKSADIYEDKINNSDLKSIDTNPPKLPWYRKPFE